MEAERPKLGQMPVQMPGVTTHLAAERIERHRAAGEWPQPGLAELAQRRKATDGDALLIVDGDLRLSACDFVERVERVAAGLSGLGLGAGDVISWELPSWWEAAVLAVAIDHIGAIGNPIIPIYRQREVAFITRQARAQALVVPAEFRGFDYRRMASAVRSANDDLEHLIVVRGEATPGMHTFAELGEGRGKVPPRHRRSPHEAAMLFYTSGTTADPKGVIHTTDTLGAYVAASAAALGSGPDDIGLLQFPLTHIGGLAAFVATPLQVGSRVVFLDAWSAERAIELIEKEGVTSAGGPPVILQGLMASPALSAERVRTLRTAGTGAAGIPPDLVRQVGEKLGAVSFRAYGLTECPMVTTGRPDDPEEKRMHTDGRPSPGCQVRIADADDRPVAAGVEGEIQVSGPQLFAGYVDASLNDAAFTPDGFLRTGDLGTVDEDGFVRVTGRLKDVVIRKGENLSATAIEEILAVHPDVADVAVVGLPDQSSGERACAVLVVKPGATAPSTASIDAFMTERGVMRQMIPEQVEIVEALPRNATGKVLKFVLRDTFKD